MSRDARFEDAGEAPLRLLAQEREDVPVISALVQDAVFPLSEMTWDRPARRFAVLLNRFRWEDKAAAEAERRPYERVQSLLSVEDAVSVASQGFARDDTTLVLSLLSVTYTPFDDGRGEILLTLAGDGAIRVVVDCLTLVLRDVTRPYAAPSGRAPEHGK